MVKIKVNSFFFIIWILFLILDKSTYVIYIFLSAVVHETAHISMFFACGAAIDTIEILPFGISVNLKNTVNVSNLKEVACALSGPFANLIYALILVFIPASFHIEGITFLISCNLAIATVNLIPIMPLDGGRALFFFLCEKLDVVKAENICFVLSFILLIPLFACAVLLIYITNYNFSLMLIFLYLLLYLMFKNNF